MFRRIVDTWIKSVDKHPCCLLLSLDYNHVYMTKNIKVTGLIILLGAIIIIVTAIFGSRSSLRSIDGLPTDANITGTESAPENQTASVNNTASEFQQNQEEDLEIPLISSKSTGIPHWRMVYTHPGRIISTSLDGEMTAITNDSETVLARISEAQPEQGTTLHGIIKDPKYDENKYVYVASTYNHDNNNGELMKYTCLTDEGDSLINEVLLLDGIPVNSENPGGIMLLAPDETVYLSVNTPEGASEIYRMRVSGTIAPDNPHAESYRLAEGFSNITDISIEGDTLLVTDEEVIHEINIDELIGGEGEFAVEHEG